MRYLKLSLSAVIFLAMVACKSNESQPAALPTVVGEVKTVSEITVAAEDYLDKLHSEVKDPTGAIDRLKDGNLYFQKFNENPAVFSPSRLEETAADGQAPFAVILSCSDSRVPPEHIFSAGVGDLFVIRTAGNVVNDFELGSIEYGVKALGAKVIVVLGHTRCGAVAAAVEGQAEGHIQSIIDEIRNGIGNETDKVVAEDLNISFSMEKIKKSDIIAELIEQGDLMIIEAKYDITTGQVDYFSQN